MLARLTGRLAGANCYGAEKPGEIEHSFGQSRAALRVIAYTDHASDLPLLSWAGDAVLVNPSRKTRRVRADHAMTVVSW